MDVVSEKSRKAEDFELEQFLPYRLSLLSNTVSEGIAQIYQRNHNLSIPEWRIMAVLGRYSDLTASQLCERTVMDKVTVSRAVNSLLEKQYVQRITDPADRRKRQLWVTRGKGRDLLNEVIPFALEYQAGLMDGLSEKEWPQLDALINKLLTKARLLNSKNPSTS